MRQCRPSHARAQTGRTARGDVGTPARRRGSPPPAPQAAARGPAVPQSRCRLSTGPAASETTQAWPGPGPRRPRRAGEGWRYAQRRTAPTLRRQQATGHAPTFGPRRASPTLGLLPRRPSPAVPTRRPAVTRVGVDRWQRTAGTGASGEGTSPLPECRRGTRTALARSTVSRRAEQSCLLVRWSCPAATPSGPCRLPRPLTRGHPAGSTAQGQGSPSRLTRRTDRRGTTGPSRWTNHRQCAGEWCRCSLRGHALRRHARLRWPAIGPATAPACR
mmetsp:Transcript_2076/g.6601  ORF Transcript_2076/g.6601 Transcript_2076/m.6601 type:complete len:274 (-) Transcript_2076:821-1642(-)